MFHASVAPRRPRRLARVVAVATLTTAALAGAVAPGTAGPANAATNAATTVSSTSNAIWRSTVRPRTPAVASRTGRTVGTQFRVSREGVATHLRFFKSSRNRGRHVGVLWTAGGRHLASVRFRNESRSGWQTARLSRPVRLHAGGAYVASYTAGRGRYSLTKGVFDSGRTAGRSPLTAVSGMVGAPGRFPRTRTSSAMFVDVSFRQLGSSSAVSVVKPNSGSFPNAATTGHGGKLSTRSGGTITTPGTVIANTVINGQLTVRANNVTLRNVYIRTGGSYGLLTYGKNTVIENATIVGTPGATVAGILAYDTGQVIARRVDVSASEDGVRLGNNSVLEDSYIHDLKGDSASHYDSVTADGFTGWRIEHNTILNHRDQTAAVWIGDNRYGPSEGILKNNFLAGGGYVIYAGPGGGAGLRVTGNVFSTMYFPNCGMWGPVTWWQNTNNTWANNTWADGSRQGQLVSP